jgi:integrase
VVNGHKHRSQHPTEEAARQWEHDRRRELEQGNASFSSEPSLREFAVAYLAHSEKFVWKTRHEKQLAFRLLMDSISPEISVTDLHKGDILAHFARQALARSGNAANKDRKNLVAAWNWAAQHLQGVPARNPFLTERFPEDRSPRRVPTEKEFWAVHRIAESDQDRLMLLCFLHLAARRNEIFRLRREDVDLDRKQVMLRTRKRRGGSMSCDWLPMSTRLHRAMTEHLSRTSGPWVFPDPQTGEPYIARQHWLSRLCRKAKVREFGLHGIRHLSASILISARVSLLDVQTILRHTNLTTTQRYVHRLESVRKAVKVFK